MVMARRTPSSSTTCCGRGRREVALLVEDVVKRQQALVLFEQQRPPSSRTAAFTAGLPLSPSGRQGHARQHGGRQIARGRGQFLDGGAAAGQKTGLFKEVGRRVAADDQLGEDRQPRALSGRAAAGSDDLFKVSGEIPHGGIDLGECDLHSFSLIPQ